MNLAHFVYFTKDHSPQQCCLFLVQLPGFLLLCSSLSDRKHSRQSNRIPTSIILDRLSKVSQLPGGVLYSTTSLPVKKWYCTSST